MPIFDGITSLWFDSEADLSLFRQAETALLASGLFDPSLSFFVYAREVVIIETTAGAR